MLLLLKIIVVPALIISVTLAGRRWGPRVGGVLASFPLVAGPVLFFLALGQSLGLPADVVGVPRAILAAISVGAVAMGANTYVGNAPNFMVRSIAEEAGIKMPSFFGYMLYSGVVLLPLFAAVTFLFF